MYLNSQFLFLLVNTGLAFIEECIFSMETTGNTESSFILGILVKKCSLAFYIENFRWL